MPLYGLCLITQQYKCHFGNVNLSVFFLALITSKHNFNLTKTPLYFPTLSPSAAEYRLRINCS